MPREAARRTATGPLPFRGLWKYLTPWNVLEFKGPTVSARLRHLDLLFELGLGIHRRLNEIQKKEGRSLISADEISFWYLVHRLASASCGPLKASSARWRASVPAFGA